MISTWYHPKAIATCFPYQDMIGLCFGMQVAQAVHEDALLLLGQKTDIGTAVRTEVGPGPQFLSASWIGH